MKELELINLTATEMAIIKAFNGELSPLTLDQLLTKTNKFLSRKIQKGALKNLLTESNKLRTLGFIRSENSLYSFNDDAYQSNQQLYEYYHKYQKEPWLQYFLELSGVPNSAHGMELHSGKCKNLNESGKRIGDCRQNCICSFIVPRINYAAINITPARNSQKIDTQINQYGTTRFVYYPSGAITITHNGTDGNGDKKALEINEFYEWLAFCKDKIKEHTNQDLEITDFFILKISFGKDADLNAMDLPSLKHTNLRLHDMLGSQYELYTYSQDTKIRIAVQKNIPEEMSVRQFLGNPNQLSVLSGIQTLDHQLAKISELEKITKENENKANFLSKQLHFSYKTVKELVTKNMPKLSDSIDDLKYEIEELKTNNSRSASHSEITNLSNEFDLFQNKFINITDNLEMNQIEDSGKLEMISNQIMIVDNKINDNQTIIEQNTLNLNKIGTKLTRMTKILSQLVQINIQDNEKVNQLFRINTQIMKMIAQINIQQQNIMETIQNDRRAHEIAHNQILNTQNILIAQLIESNKSIFQKISEKLRKRKNQS